MTPKILIPLQRLDSEMVETVEICPMNGKWTVFESDGMMLPGDHENYLTLEDAAAVCRERKWRIVGVMGTMPPGWTARKESDRELYKAKLRELNGE
jgi:hypothetical protein